MNGNIVLQKDFLSEKILKAANEHELGSSFPYSELLLIVRYLHDKYNEIEKEIHKLIRID